MLTRLLSQGLILGKEKKENQGFKLKVETLQDCLLEVKLLVCNPGNSPPSTVLLCEL